MSCDIATIRSLFFHNFLGCTQTCFFRCNIKANQKVQNFTLERIVFLNKFCNLICHSIFEDEIRFYIDFHGVCVCIEAIWWGSKHFFCLLHGLLCCIWKADAVTLDFCEKGYKKCTIRKVSSFHKLTQLIVSNSIALGTFKPFSGLQQPLTSNNWQRVWRLRGSMYKQKIFPYCFNPKMLLGKSTFVLVSF